MKFRYRTPNKYSIALLLIIISMCMGTEFFGSYQPTRLLLLFFFIYYIQNIAHQKLITKQDQPIWIGIILSIIWIVYGCLSLVWSPVPLIGIKSELIVMCIGFTSLPLIFFLIKKIQDPLKLLRQAWLACFMITAIIAIVELITWKHLPTADQERILGGINVAVRYAATTFGNLNNYGVFIVFVLPYLLWGVTDEVPVKKKIVYLLASVLGIVIIVINGSRMGMFVAVFQVFCFLLPIIRNIKWKYLVGIFLLLVIVISFLPMEQILYTMRYRMHGAFQSGDESTSERFAMIKSGFEMLLGSYGFGVGAGGFETAVVHQPSFLGNIVNPHNLFVEIFAQYGIFIFIPFCFWLFTILYYAMKNENISVGARTAVCATILTLPFIGMMNSHALGYTYLWLFLSCVTVVSAYRPFNY